MNNKVCITGATGFIGRKLVSKLLYLGYEITVITRSIEKTKFVLPSEVKYLSWNSAQQEFIDALFNTGTIIHLAGENLLSRLWTKKQKNLIRSSRINSTKRLIEIITMLDKKPRVFIAASGINYYGNTENQVDELSPKGKDFLADVVAEWENETKQVDILGVRRINLRTGIVFDKNEGAFAKMVLPFKLFLGGPLGSGNQWMSWIHIEDLINMYVFLLENENTSGVVNGVAPNPVRMKAFAKTLGAIMHRPTFFRVPSFVLKIILGEAATLVLDGANVFPKKAVEYGFKFQFENLDEAIKKILSK